MSRHVGARRGTGAAFAAPYLVVFVVFGLLPLAMSVFIAFTDMRAADVRTPFNVDPVGFEQFARLFRDARFLQSLGNTLVFVVAVVPLTLAAGMALAAALNRGIGWLCGVLRVSFYVPVVASIVAIAVVWRFMLQPDGLINSLLHTVGVVGPDWLHDTRWAMPSMIAMAVWRNMGNMMVLFLAGLQGLPRDLYDAAAVDGAGRWRSFRAITLPLMRPVLLLASVLLTTSSLQVFEEPFVLTNGGGPAGSTTSISIFVFTHFGLGNYAYGTAAAYVVFVIVAALSILQFRLLRSKER